MIRTLTALALLALLITAGAVALFARALHQPGAQAAETVFVVEAGERFPGVARRLIEGGLIQETRLLGVRTLTAYARLRDWDRQIKSGEYDLSPELSPEEILSKLVAGEVKTHAVTIPPGLAVHEIARRLADAGVVDRDSFSALAHDPEFARELGIEQASLEGYLLPETYRFRRDSPASQVLRRMVELFHAAWSEDDRKRLEAFRFGLHEVVTLASIVEKETADPEERRLIAAVFDNRLRRKMRLQSDPTVIYGIRRSSGHFDGNLRRRDLETDTPYNTYTRNGFPPGPIASPSMESIRAVLDPAASDALYFVSRNDGTHQFSATLSEHLAAVDRYQRRSRSQP